MIIDEDLALCLPAVRFEGLRSGWSKSLTTRSAKPITSGGGRWGRLGRATTDMPAPLATACRSPNPRLLRSVVD
jgi:hypothetical protein